MSKKHNNAAKKLETNENQKMINCEEKREELSIRQRAAEELILADLRAKARKEEFDQKLEEKRKAKEARKKEKAEKRSSLKSKLAVGGIVLGTIGAVVLKKKHDAEEEIEADLDTEAVDEEDDEDEDEAEE